MTEAQQAHLRLMESTPRDRIHTHEGPAPDLGMGWQRNYKNAHPSDKRRSQITPQMRRWIADNANTHSQREMCAHLKVSRSAVRICLSVLGIKARRQTSSGRLKLLQWLKENAPNKTAAELSRDSRRHISTICTYLKEFGIKAKPSPVRDNNRIKTLHQWLRDNAAQHTLAETSRICGRTHSVIRWNLNKLSLTCKQGKRVGK